MSYERDELKDIINDALGEANNGNLNKFVADMVLRAGFRKPQVITTREELDSLPVGTAIIDDEPPIWLWAKSWESKHPRKDGTPLSKWSSHGCDDERETGDIPLPATVVWGPIPNDG